MAVIDLTKENFEQTIVDNELVLVDFWAEWCGPCKSFAPVYEEVSGLHEDVIFGKVDTEAQRELAQHFQIRSIPTLALFRDNILLMQEAGALPKSALEQVVQKAKALDMDQVRKDIEEQQVQRQAE
jgi:thioredoxin